MPADLPTAIRAALHANDISAADLRQPRLREAPARPRRPGRLLATVASAAVVAALAVAISVVAANRTSGHHLAGGSVPLAGIVGYRWQLVELHDQHGALAVPASIHASIAFTPDGYVLGHDSLNPVQAEYRAVSNDQYTVHQSDFGAVGSVPGLGPGAAIKQRVVGAVDEMFLTNLGSSLLVTARAVGDTLTLQHDHVTLTLRRAGRQGNFVPESPSPTPTVSGSRTATH
jgi:hypothetical protein